MERARQVPRSPPRSRRCGRLDGHGVHASERWEGSKCRRSHMAGRSARGRSRASLAARATRERSGAPARRRPPHRDALAKSGRVETVSRSDSPPRPTMDCGHRRASFWPATPRARPPSLPRQRGFDLFFTSAARVPPRGRCAIRRPAPLGRTRGPLVRDWLPAPPARALLPLAPLRRRRRRQALASWETARPLDLSFQGAHEPVRSARVAAGEGDGHTRGTHPVGCAPPTAGSRRAARAARRS